MSGPPAIPRLSAILNIPIEEPIPYFLPSPATIAVAEGRQKARAVLETMHIVSNWAKLLVSGIIERQKISTIISSITSRLLENLSASLPPGAWKIPFRRKLVEISIPISEPDRPSLIPAKMGKKTGKYASCKCICESEGK